MLIGVVIGRADGSSVYTPLICTGVALTDLSGDIEASLLVVNFELSPLDDLDKHVGHLLNNYIVYLGRTLFIFHSTLLFWFSFGAIANLFVHNFFFYFNFCYNFAGIYSFAFFNLSCVGFLQSIILPLNLMHIGLWEAVTDLPRVFETFSLGPLDAMLYCNALNTNHICSNKIQLSTYGLFWYPDDSTHGNLPILAEL